MSTTPQILVVEDEPSILDTILYALTGEGMEATGCSTGEAAIEHLESHTPDLIVLDVGLPDTTGFDLCREIRKTTATPIIFLTARANEIDRIVGLEIGGDDYVVKPFSPRELAARVRAVLRRTAPEPDTPTNNTTLQVTIQSAPASPTTAPHSISPPQNTTSSPPFAPTPAASSPAPNSWTPPGQIPAQPSNAPSTPTSNPSEQNSKPFPQTPRPSRPTAASVTPSPSENLHPLPRVRRRPRHRVRRPPA